MSQMKPYKDAVPTIYGWAHHITGELLVSFSGLENPVLGYKPNCPFKQTLVDIVEVVNEPIITEDTKIDNTIESETIVEIEQTIANIEETSKTVKRTRNSK